jgi:hypothetical protein
VAEDSGGEGDEGENGGGADAVPGVVRAGVLGDEAGRVDSARSSTAFRPGLVTLVVTRPTRTGRTTETRRPSQ